METRINPSLRFRWWWLIPSILLFLILAAFSALLYLQQNTSNVMHPALDELAALPLEKRWSHPQMLKIREQGAKAVPYLRAVLAEKDHPATHFLIWLKTKHPDLATPFKIPDLAKMTERRWVACQAIQTLGPAAKPAIPELIEIYKSTNIIDFNAASMALHTIGIDNEICEKFAALLDENKSLTDPARGQIVRALGNVKPPSARALKVLIAALGDSQYYVQQAAAESLGRVGARQPEVISALKKVQAASTDSLLVVTASVSLWQLEKDSALALPPILKALENERAKPIPQYLPRGASGQGVGHGDQLFMIAGPALVEMKLSDPEKSKALRLFEQWDDKVGRIFISMVLLPSMMDLGYPSDKCFEICQTGLSKPEDYYRLQAARLLVSVAEKFPDHPLDLDPLLHHQDVGVRNYAAKIHWRKTHNPDIAVPILIESLDRQKHQSYYYDIEILPAALTALAEIGPAAKSALDPLQILSKDPNPKIAAQAEETLAKIRNRRGKTNAFKL